MFHCDSEFFIHRTYSEVPISSSSQTPYNIKGGEVLRHSPSYQTSLPRVQRLTIHTTQREVSVWPPVTHPSEWEESIRSCSGDASGCIGLDTVNGNIIRESAAVILWCRDQDW